MSYSIEFRQQLKQEQKLVMTQAMHMAFHVLTLPILELSSWVEGEVEKNPLLQLPLLPRKKPEEFLELVQVQESLYFYLLRMIPLHFKEEEERKVAEYIAASLNEKGFLSFSIQELATQIPIECNKLQEILHRFHQIEPIGMGSVNAQQSLLIQLEAKSREKGITYAVVQHHFEDFIHRRFASIAKRLAISPKKLEEEIKRDLLTLSPFPAHSFSTEKTHHLTADIFATKEEEGWKIEVNEEWLPSLSIEPFYLNVLKEKGGNIAERKWMKPFLSSRKWLLQTLEKRKKILLSITTYLTKNQGAYLEGVNHSPHPIGLKEVAFALELHTSTIARATANKVISTPRGLIKMRDCFTSALHTKEGVISTQKAKELLASFLKEEDQTHPFSDQELSKKLEELGVFCARRTVAKYRKQLEILSSHKRKQ